MVPHDRRGHARPAAVFASLISQVAGQLGRAHTELYFLELKQEVNRAYRASDKLAVQHIVLKQRYVYKEYGISMPPGPMLLIPFVQPPITLGMFFGVKCLCALLVTLCQTSNAPHKKGTLIIFKNLLCPEKGVILFWFKDLINSCTCRIDSSGEPKFLVLVPERWAPFVKKLKLYYNDSS